MFQLTHAHATMAALLTRAQRALHATLQHTHVRVLQAVLQTHARRVRRVTSRHMAAQNTAPPVGRKVVLVSTRAVAQINKIARRIRVVVAQTPIATQQRIALGRARRAVPQSLSSYYRISA
jgi:hypothetical protein